MHRISNQRARNDVKFFHNQSKNGTIQDGTGFNLSYAMRLVPGSNKDYKEFIAPIKAIDDINSFLALSNVDSSNPESFLQHVSLMRLINPLLVHGVLDKLFDPQFQQCVDIIIKEENHINNFIEIPGVLGKLSDSQFQQCVDIIIKKVDNINDFIEISGVLGKLSDSQFQQCVDAIETTDNSNTLTVTNFITSPGVFKRLSDAQFQKIVNTATKKNKTESADVFYVNEFITSPGVFERLSDAQFQQCVDAIEKIYSGPNNTNKGFYISLFIENPLVIERLSDSQLQQCVDACINSGEFATYQGIKNSGFLDKLSSVQKTQLGIQE